jgi:uncharacterized protein (TIGR00255 family)
MKSMTGYGRAQDNTPIGIITVELTSVNHRNLDIRLRLPEMCRSLDIALRRLLKNHLRRGHVEGSVKIERDEAASSRDIVLNMPIATAYYNEAKRFYESTGIDTNQDFSWIFLKPEVWQVPETLAADAIQSAIFPVFENALSQLVSSREQEGEALKSFFMEKIGEINPIMEEIETFMPTLPLLVKESLIKKLQELKQDPSLNPDRLAQEIAYLAQRADITEEASRLHAHLKTIKGKIRKKTINGRELDFTIQEMNREVNTMGSKSVSYELSSKVVRLKEILNQLREQAQNVE